MSHWPGANDPNSHRWLRPGSDKPYTDPMQKPETNEQDVQMSDILCDYCNAHWTDDRPMVEGHQGSCICSNCLSIAFAELVHRKHSSAAEGYKCQLCLEERDEIGWQSPVNPEFTACRRCVNQSARVLAKDPDYGWSLPAAD